MAKSGEGKSPKVMSVLAWGLVSMTTGRIVKIIFGSKQEALLERCVERTYGTKVYYMHEVIQVKIVEEKQHG